jgi:signal transduction histidine kinase
LLVSSRLERHREPTSFVGSLTDITARKRAEEALRATEGRLYQAQKMEAVGQLTGGIAHDFNNILQSIVGGLDLMERSIARGNNAEGATRYIDIARKSANRAAGLTHRMLAFARRQVLLPRVVETDKLVHGMGELIRQTMGPTVEVQIRLHDGTWRVLCDPNQLESALLNLAINARDAMPAGGTLTVTTADRSLTNDDLFDQDEPSPGEYVEIAVSDTGLGMTPDVISHVFEPFFTTKPTGQGTGLGLSQVFGFVRQSGGFLRLESEPGIGTTVRIFMPRHQAMERDDSEQVCPDVPVSADIGAAGAVGKTVLVVEDEADVRAMIADLLRDLGCRVIEAEDGNSGLRRVQSLTQLDMLVTDVGLPGLNGRQLADAARESRPRLPVLLITGYAGKVLEDTEFASGMEVLRKPFASDAFAVRVSALLDHHQWHQPVGRRPL